jgi:hypothetical protein
MLQITGRYRDVRNKTETANNDANKDYFVLIFVVYCFLYCRQCCGSGMFIPDPTFFHPGSQIRNVPDPDADFLPIPDPGSRGQKGTGSRIRIRNTDCRYIFQSSKIVSHKKVTEQQNQGFSSIFGLLMQGSGSVQIITDPDPGGPKTYGTI